MQVDCNYPGASARSSPQTVAAPIEQQVNGVEDMLYMSSQSTNDGSYTLTVTFKPGVDLELAQVLVQNRVSLAMPLAARRRAADRRARRKKRSPDILLTVSLNSPDGRYDQLYLSNYAVLHVKDELARLAGHQRSAASSASAITACGSGSIPTSWPSANLTVDRRDRRDPRAERAGRRWARSASRRRSTAQALQIPLTMLGRLDRAGRVRRRSSSAPTPDGRHAAHSSDVGRVELGARSQDISNRFDGKPTVGLADLPVARRQRAGNGRLRQSEDGGTVAATFPRACDYEIGYDTTPFIRESIDEVFKSLRDASSWWRSWCWCFCKAGGRRSFR